MTTADLVEIGKELAAKTREFVAREIGQLAGRLQSLEERMATVKDGERGPEGPQGLQGPQGIKGLDGAPGRDGRDGIDGKDGAPGDRGERGERGEKGIAGDQGPVGPSGVAGIDGKDGASGPQGEPGLIGPPGDMGPTGPKGDQGERGAQGDRGEPGPAGRDGIDGKSVTLEDVRPVFDAEVAKTVLELERRAMDTIQRAIDRMPVPVNGKDGRDGLGYDDMTEELEDGGRFVVRRFMRDGAVVKEFRHQTQQVIFRGLFTEGKTYEAGDCVVWNGSSWIATSPTSAKPGLMDAKSRAWTLSGKRGSDGKQGPEGKPGPQGPQGPPPTRAQW